MIIEWIYKAKAGKKRTETEDGDDASTVALDETDTAEERTKFLLELEAESQEPILPEETVSVEKKLEPIAEDLAEEIKVSEDAEQHYDGAAGLWGEEYQLPCFVANPPTQSVFESIEYQQSPFAGLVGIDWFLPTTPQIQVAQSVMVNNYKTPTCGPILDALTRQFDEALVFTKEGADCEICQRPLDVGRGVVLKDCHHTFCRRCLTHAIEHKEHPVMVCPSKSVRCEGEVREDEIKALLTEGAYEDYVLGTLAKMGIFENIDNMIEHIEYIETKVEFHCGICTRTIVPGDGITLMNCGHEYCKTCLGRYIQTSVEAVVPCPHRAEDGDKCIGTFMDTEIRSLVSVEVCSDRLKRSLDQAKATIPNVYQCKTPGCPVWVEIEDIEEYQCEGCKRVNCVKCQAVHQGVTCENYQEMTHGGNRRAREVALTENQVRGLINTKEAQPCPQCGILAERISGCRDMTCTRCNHEFQWRI